MSISIGLRTAALSFMIGSSMASSCGWYLVATPSFAPAPPFDCFASAMQALPEARHIGRVSRHQGDEYLDVELQDSTAKSVRFRALIARGSHHGVPNDTLVVSTVWGGPKRPPAIQVESAAQVLGRLVGHLRAQCAPNTPSEFPCTFAGEPIRCGPIT